MKRVGLFLVITVAVFGFFAEMSGHAATYKYTDKDGNVGLADDLGSIPAQYRATAVLISGSSKEDSPSPDAQLDPKLQGQPAVQTDTAPPVLTPQAASAPAEVVQAPRQETQGQPFSIRLAISIGVVIAAIFVSVFLGKISAMHGHDRAIHILRVSLSWLVVVYLVVAHAKDVMTLAKIAGGHVQSVSEQSAKKGEKAAKAIKTMEAVLDQAEKRAQENEQSLKEGEQAAEQ